MTKITISLDDEERSILQKRASKNLFTVKEQIEDIIRRSLISYKGKSPRSRFKADDKLIRIFSRERRGRKRKKK